MRLAVYPGTALKNKGNQKQGIMLPGDKSLSHRAALFGALANGESKIHNFLVSGVTYAMLNALSDLAVSWRLEGDILTIKGNGLRGLNKPQKPINCGNSATTLRMLAGAVVASGIEAELTGSEGLKRRPMGRIVEPLKLMGAEIEAQENGTAPLLIKARSENKPLKAIHYTLPVASAQVKSCLLLAALSAERATVLLEPGPSRDHTERMLRGMGVSILSEKCEDSEENAGGDCYRTKLTPPSHLYLSPLELTLPGDISSAAFLIVAALITPGSDLLLRNVGLNITRTGIVDVLNQMGAEISLIEHENSDNAEPAGDIHVQYRPLCGVKVSGTTVVRMIDEFPAFAVAAAYASGTTVVQDAEELRNKESDRITALINELNVIGVEASETEDGFIIHGGKSVKGGTVNPHGDHRLAMSMAICGLAAERPILIDHAEIINESFPEFIQILQDCGGHLQYRD